MSGPLYPPLRAVIFDLDGTLVDSAPDLAFAANRMLAAGCPVICVPHGYNEGEPDAALNTDAVVPTLVESTRIVIASRTSLSAELRA